MRGPELGPIGGTWAYSRLAQPGRWPLRVVPASEPGLDIRGLLWGLPRGTSPDLPSVEAGAWPSHLGWPGAGRPLAAGAQGCPWNPGEQRGGHGAGCRWAWRGGGHSLHPSPSPLRAQRVLGVRVGWPFQSSRAGPGDSVLRGTEGPRSSSLFPTRLSRPPWGRRGPRRGHGYLQRRRPCPWLQQQRLSWGLGDVCVHWPRGTAPRLMLAM